MVKLLSYTSAKSKEVKLGYFKSNMVDTLHNQFKDLSSEELGFSLEHACLAGDLEVVKYLLTTPETKNRMSLEKDCGIALIIAAQEGNIELIRYLLTSEELEYHPDINYGNSSPIIWACMKKQKEVIEYLLFSPELKINADININLDGIFGQLLSNDYTDILQKILSQQNVNKTEKIEIYLKMFPNEYVEKLFEVKKFNHELSGMLREKSITLPKKSKL